MLLQQQMYRRLTHTQHLHGAAGSAPRLLPGEASSLKLPPEVIEQLKTRVFGFDTFWYVFIKEKVQVGYTLWMVP